MKPKVYLNYGGTCPGCPLKSTTIVRFNGSWSKKDLLLQDYAI